MSRSVGVQVAHIVLLLGVTCLVTHTLPGQVVDGLRSAATPKLAAFAAPHASDTIPGLPNLRFPRWRRLPKSTAPLASLFVPGAGQLMLGQDRFVVYTALEGLFWWQFAKVSNERSQQEADFRDIARRVARAHLSPNGPDGDWAYYEAMRDFDASGQFSKSDDATRLVPETDRATFNGRTWALAKGLNPDSVSALVYYREHAYGPNMLWSWQNAGFQKDQFAQATNKRNDANNAMNDYLMLLAANHLLSMVDAFATFRLQARPVGNGRTALEARLSW